MTAVERFRLWRQRRRELLCRDCAGHQAVIAELDARAAVHTNRGEPLAATRIRNAADRARLTYTAHRFDEHPLWAADQFHYRFAAECAQRRRYDTDRT